MLIFSRKIIYSSIYIVVACVYRSYKSYISGRNLYYKIYIIHLLVALCQPASKLKYLLRFVLIASHINGVLGIMNRLIKILLIKSQKLSKIKLIICRLILLKLVVIKLDHLKSIVIKLKSSRKERLGTFHMLKLLL